MTDPVFEIRQQLFPPGPKPPDAILVYEGTEKQYQPWANEANGGFWAWDLRGPLLRLCWDLLRFQKIGAGKLDSDRQRPRGLRDSINSILYLTEQNNAILQRLAKVGNIDISDILSR